MSSCIIDHTWVIENARHSGKRESWIFRYFDVDAMIDHKNLCISLKYKQGWRVLECNFSLLKSKSGGEKLITKQALKNSLKLHFEAKFDDFLKYVINDELTIHLTAYIYCNDDFQMQIPVIMVPQNKLHEGIQSLREDEALVDMTISCEGETFKVHKAVLAAQSPVLRKMFQVDIKEKQASVVEMKDVSPAVVSDLLAYLYTGEAPNIKTLAKELMAVAHRYEIPNLLYLCQKQLFVDLGISNVLEIYFLSKLYDAGDLKKACVRFLSANLTDLSTISGWDNLTQSDENAVLHEIIENFL